MRTAPGRSPARAATWILLTAAVVAPWWVTRHVPTQDGPSHLYNAQVLLGLLTGDPFYAQGHTIHAEAFPHWLAHLLLAALQGLVSAGVAEKLLLSGYAVALPLAVHALARAARPDGHAASWLAFPLVSSLPLYMGFYGFCLGVPLALAAVALWWRWREQLNAARLAALAALLVLTYFAHLVAVAVACVTITLAAPLLLRARWGALARTAVALAPTGALLATYLATFPLGHAPTPGAPPSAWSLFADLVTLRVLHSHEPAQLWIGRGVAAVIAGLALTTAAGRIRRARRGPREDGGARWLEPADALLAPVAGLLAVYTLLPGEIGSGGWFHERIALLLPLLLLPWLRPPRARSTRAVFGAIVVALTVAAAATQIRAHRRWMPAIDEYVALADQVRPGDVVLPLHLRRAPGDERVNPLAAAANHYCLGRDAVNLANFETQFSYFPVHFRGPEVLPPHAMDWPQALLFNPRSIDVCGHRGALDLLVVWNRDPSVEDAFARCARVVGEHGRMRVYRRDPGGAAAATP